MPYHLVRRKKGSKRGWVVQNRDTGKVYSHEPLSYADALAQLRALEVNTQGKTVSLVLVRATMADGSLALITG